MILECRRMTWDENADFIDFRDEVVKENPNISSTKLATKLTKYVFEKVYPDVNMNDLTPKEAIEVFSRTIDLTEEVREEEIKNLRPSLDGIKKRQTTVKTAKN